MIEVILKNLLGYHHDQTMPRDFAYDHGERVRLEEALDRLLGKPLPEVERRRSSNDDLGTAG